MKKIKNSISILLGACAVIGILAVLILLNSKEGVSVRTALLLAQETTSTSGTPVAPTAPATPAVNVDTQNAQETLKRNKENYQNRSNEVKNNFRNQNVDLGELNALMTQWSGLHTQMQSALDSAITSGDLATFWDLNTQQDTKSQEINDAFTKAYGLSNFASAQNQALKEKPRQLKDTERQLSDIKRNAKKTTLDTSALDSYITQLKDIIAKMQAIANTSTSGLAGQDIEDLAKDIWDLNSDYDGISRDFNDLQNELNQQVNSQNQIENAQRNLKDKTRTISDAEREYKRLSKQVGADKVTEMAAAIQKLKDVYAQIETAIANKDVETLNDDRDFWDANQDVQDIRQALDELSNQANQQKDVQRIVKEKDRQIKDMRRECKKVECENSETGKILVQLEELLTKMGTFASTTASNDFQAFWDLNSQFDELNREYWDNISQQTSTKDITRWLKDISREVKDKGRWVADLEREARSGKAAFSAEEIANLQSIYDKMVDVAKRAEQAVASGDSKTAQDILNYEYNDLRGEFDMITQNIGSKKEAGFMQFEVENIGRDLENAKAQLEKALETGEIDQQRADLCSGYIAEGYKLFDGLKQIVSSGKVGGQEELMIRFEKLGNQADRDCGDIFGRQGGNSQSYVQYYVRDDLQGLADQIFAKISEKLENEFMTKVLNSIAQYQSAINSMLEQAGQKWQAQLQSTFEAAMPVWDLTVSKENIEPLLNKKARLLELNKQMDEKIAYKTKELEDLQNKITSYNFYGNAGDNLETKIETFMEQAPSLSGDRVAAGIRELKNEAEQAIKLSNEEKFQDGVIPFKDADDNAWYTRYVATLSNNGIVSGYKDANGNPTGQFGPGDQVSVSQVLKMALEASGKGQADGEPSLGQAKDHWSRGYVKEAENLGLSIVKGLNNLDRPATRGEVVRIILEVKGISPENVNQSSFRDVTSSNPNIGYIEEAKTLGIVSGDSETGTFRPNDGVNRAEAAKVVNNALTIIFGSSEQEVVQ